MIQVSRDAGHTHRGHQDRPLDGLDRDWLLARRLCWGAATWSEDARCCRGFQENDVPGAGISGQSTSGHVTPGSDAPGHGGLAESTQFTGLILAAPQLHGTQRFKDDNLAAEARRTGAIGDSGRQDLGLSEGATAGLLCERRLLKLKVDLSKTDTDKILMAIMGARAVGVSYLRVLMESRLAGSKGSGNTTKNDNTRSWQFDSHCRRGSALGLTDLSAGWRSSMGGQSTARRRLQCVQAAGRSAGLPEPRRKLPEHDCRTVERVAACSNERPRSLRQAGDFRWVIGWGVRLD